MKFKILLLVVCAWLGVALPVRADSPQQNANWPWQLLNGGYNSTVRGAWLLALPDLPANDKMFKLFQDAALFMGADQGGISRSVLPDGPNTTDLANKFGRDWEVVNGGRGVSDSACGGYGALAGPSCGNGGANVNAHGPLLYGGPPSVLNTYDIGGMAAGGWPTSLGPTGLNVLDAISDFCLSPTGHLQRATGPVYVLSGNAEAGELHFSPDAGRQWFPLAPQCALNASIGYRALAVDAGKPGHVVVASRPDGNGIHDVGGCKSAEDNPCSARQVAWTNDVGLQMFKSLQSTAAQNAATPFDIDLAGHASATDDAHGWRFSMISHLVRTSLAGATSNHVCPYDPAVRLAHDNACTPKPGVSVCHGAKATGEDKAEQS